MPVISAFCSPERGGRAAGVGLGCGFWEERVVRFGLLGVVFDLVEGVFLVVALFDRVDVERGFAVVLRLVWVMISS
jgi:hypothetical protein